LKKDLEYWLSLSLINNLNNHLKLEALSIFGSPRNILKAHKEALLRAGFTSDNYEALHSQYIKDEANRILEYCQKNKIKILTLNDEEYPELLKFIYDPPMVLYVRGTIPKLNAVAMVGSRKASGYGIETAVKLSSQLALAGILVVSGMARGIDTASHCGAMKEERPTVAVLGCGVDITYPPENQSLMERIIEYGAVVSEFPPGTRPAPYNFPSRNRIISGMSSGTVVVEAGLKSGSLITAKYALEQGREVFAVPGNINLLNSQGTNMLIKDGAKIVLNVEDILEELNFGIAPIVSNRSDILYSESLNEKHKKIIAALKIEDLYDEELSNKISVPLDELYELLLDLELKGIVKKSITGRYMLIA